MQRTAEGIGAQIFTLGEQNSSHPQYLSFSSEWLKGYLFRIQKINHGWTFMLLKKQTKRSAENVKLLQDINQASRGTIVLTF